MSVINETNLLIRQKCPEMWIDFSQNNDIMTLSLKRNEIIVSRIDFLFSDGRNIQIKYSDTAFREGNKKYNSILTSVLVMLLQSSFPQVENLYSITTNWKRAFLLYKRGFIPVHVIDKNINIQYLSQDEVQTIFTNKNRLYHLLSGDEIDERKPWTSVKMVLSLRTHKQQEFRNISIKEMLC